MFNPSQVAGHPACCPQAWSYSGSAMLNVTFLLLQVYDGGAVFDPKVLDITDDDLSKFVQQGIQRIAAACLALNYPTLASIPHSVINGYKNVLAVSVETEYTFPLAEKVPSRLLSNLLLLLHALDTLQPSRLHIALPAASCLLAGSPLDASHLLLHHHGPCCTSLANQCISLQVKAYLADPSAFASAAPAAAAGDAAPAEEKKEEKPAEEEEESDEDMGFSLFD